MSEAQKFSAIAYFGAIACAVMFVCKNIGKGVCAPMFVFKNIRIGVCAYITLYMVLKISLVCMAV